MSSQSFVIVRAVDSFGDSWPLANPFAGIDGVRHANKIAADKVVARYRAEKEFRKTLRERNGWQPNTVRALQCVEIFEK